MKPLLLPLLLLQTTSTSAWTFTWRNASSASFLKNSHDPLPCTNIDQAEGQRFDFHPESDNYNFYIWATENCTGEYAGYTTPDVWRKKASQNLRSYLVDYGDGSGPKSTALVATSTAEASSTSSASTAEATSTSTSTPTGTAASSASASASTSPESNGAAISGGAIAGIVIAVVAGLSILGAGFFYLGRRARRGNSPSSSPSNPPSQPPQDMYASPGGNNSFAATAQYPPSLHHGGQTPQQSMGHYGDAASPLGHTQSPYMETTKLGSQKSWVELPGDDMMAELSNSRQVNELEGHSKMRYQ
ncbi:hypothetical protein P170DRAFT_434302 [Aspergillus steynii IBT 23096]|uniref:Mid2 domain-containing protein n=1 Tax=Aspergillus steynii IBT 23096 TaxID=1392250 RepID=A0A2I2GI82_9EURO|nr:uncharacterized protein P170DRAFT_434302 [Aspergillus steynii IBT 23096]PLB52588.1 hypothetical protein P170DRAFT_434302 [Aspergillus steynii IBT 23096]